MADVPELGAAAARARATQDAIEADLADIPDPAAEGETGPGEVASAPQIVPVTTAFLVCWVNGEVIVSADLDTPIVTDHIPTSDEILGAAAVLVSDRGAERTAGLAGEILPHVTAEATVSLIEARQREALAKMQAARDKALGEQLLGQGRG